MAGNASGAEKFLKNNDKNQFQIEMHNVPSVKEAFTSMTQDSLQAELKQPSYIQPGINSQGSVLSLKQGSEIHLLTEPHACIYEQCMKFHSPINNDPESPVNPLKTAFFYLVLILLVVWILVYALLNQMNYL